MVATIPNVYGVTPAYTSAATDVVPFIGLRLVCVHEVEPADVIMRMIGHSDQFTVLATV